ncbi:MAG: type III-B CRISPR-associated protein Cas10/Cmr2 [Mariprofundales bacterium]|nr:type III-B CRISPR-associated protein Cas10/Cmr2 [Mariprofundales bacterium]
MNDRIWQAKLAARIHDPAEKALVLMTDPTGHEGGTVRALRHRLFPDGIPSDLKAITQRADHWASAADRPQFPQDNQRYAKWAQVRFAEYPELVHPLTGEHYKLENLREVDFQQIKAISGDHFDHLIQHHADGSVNWQQTVLAFWRFGPELDGEGLKLLWQLLPADTRVPDHTIWAHLDMTSAFAGAMAADRGHHPALLTISFGPVQSFIAQARSTSDLWAGSHLLSRLAWQGLKVICEACGPDAVLFPQLHGVPLVDAWIKEQLGGWPQQQGSPDWMHGTSDSNPLYAAALPNRFVAIVPADQAAALAGKVEAAVRSWVRAQGEEALQRLLAKSDVGDLGYAAEQMERHLADFPEVQWLAVPWSLITGEGKEINSAALEAALRQFHSTSQEKPGFLGSKGWKLLSKELELEGHRFFHPNGGVLYPALFDLLERAHAASKSLRRFKPQHEEGYRCSLCGEREWLSPEKTDLFKPQGRRDAVLWQQLPPSWSRKGKEQLCGLCTLKRLWPTLFAEEVKAVTGGEQVSRFVVSTHTMALANDLIGLQKPPEGELRSALEQIKEGRAALPAKLARDLLQQDRTLLNLVGKLPLLLDQLRDTDQEQERQAVERLVKEWLGHKPEAYYGFIMMDGDHMGAWLAGNEDFTRLSYEKCWHSRIKNAVQEKVRGSAELEQYLAEPRPVSPARHAAISASLNAFALDLTRYAVEEAHHGKLIYAGGDDLLAMIPAGELTSCMVLLRLLYSGAQPQYGKKIDLQDGLQLENGFVRYRKRLIRLMGGKATASAGAVLAHHSAPLQRVLKELRAAEQTAKEQGGRDAFSIRILKRAGGTVSTTAKWFAPQDGVSHPIELLQALAQALGGDDLSRRAAYHAQAWLRQLPTRAVMKDLKMDDAMFERMLKANLERQFRQQHGGDAAVELAGQLAELACRVATGRENGWLEEMLAVAEFLGREGRMGGKA